MPYYRGLYKTDADTDGQEWPLGEYADKIQALSAMNSIIKSKIRGILFFASNEDIIGYYSLVEKKELNGPEVIIQLTLKENLA
jgi:hypothetical protein